MLNEIIEILEYIVTGIIPAVLVLYIIYMVFALQKRRSTIKHFISITCLIALVMSTMICMVFSIYNVGTILNTLEEEQVVEPWIKSFMFLMVETFYTIIFIIGIFIITYFEKHQIIPGHGSIKNRIKHQWKTFKEELNEYRRKRTTQKHKKEK